MPNPTARNRFEKQDLGSNVDQWGDPKINSVFERADEALDGILTVATAGGITTLTNTDYVANEARNRVILVTGALAANAEIVVPNQQKWYWVRNATTGSFVVTMRTAAGVSADCRQGRTTAILCNATDCFVMGSVRLDQLDPPTADVSFGNRRILNLSDGTNPTDGATFGQVNMLIGGDSPFIPFLLWHMVI